MADRDRQTTGHTVSSGSTGADWGGLRGRVGRQLSDLGREEAYTPGTLPPSPPPGPPLPSRSPPAPILATLPHTFACLLASGAGRHWRGGGRPSVPAEPRGTEGVLCLGEQTGGERRAPRRHCCSHVGPDVGEGGGDYEWRPPLQHVPSPLLPPRPRFLTCQHQYPPASRLATPPAAAHTCFAGWRARTGQPLTRL